MNDEMTIGGVDIWIDADGDLRVDVKAGENVQFLTRDEAAALWPLIKRFAETGRLTEEVAP